MRKSKNCYFYNIFVSPGDASGAITLNVVWMEREFDANKLSRSMYSSIFNSFPVIRTASAKKSPFLRTAGHIFHTPLHSTPPLGGFPSEYRHPLWYGKTRMVWLPDGEKIRRYLYSFSRNSRTWRTDRRTPHHGIYSAYAYALRGKKNYNNMLSHFHRIPERDRQTDRQTDRIDVSI